MKKYLFLAVVLFVSTLTFPAMHASANTYTTNFPLTENPISEGGRWLNGNKVGLDWCNVQTAQSGATRYALGVPPCSTIYADPVAILAGTWGTTQSTSATVFIAPGGDGTQYPEVELHTNMTMAAHYITGYEFDCGITAGGSYGMAIVRWNGPLANPTNSNNGFTYLAHTEANVNSCVNGDKIQGINTGSAINNLQFYRNGALIVQATDHMYTNGAPGIGFNAGEGSTYVQSGLTSFSATDQVASSGASVQKFTLYNASPNPTPVIQDVTGRFRSTSLRQRFPKL